MIEKEHPILEFLLDLSPIIFIILTFGCGILGIVFSILSIHQGFSIMSYITCIFSGIGGAMAGILLYWIYEEILEYLFKFFDRI